MIVKTYDIKGELYATYTGVAKILMDYGGINFTLEYAGGEPEKLSVQEVKMEVGQ